MEYNAIKNRVIEYLFPTRCPLCDEIVPFNQKIVCEPCRKNVPALASDLCEVCGKPLDSKVRSICMDCHKDRPIFTKNFSLYAYDIVLRESIQRFKNGQRPGYREVFGYEIITKYREQFNKLSIDLIVPVPLHYSKMLKRGYNQSMLLAQEIGKWLEIPVSSRLIEKTQRTKPMKQLNRLERYRALKNAFVILNAEQVKNKTILLVDDIYTTGTTGRIISKLLMEAGCSAVYMATIAIGEET